MFTDIKACLFDMDGTLIDSMGLWHDVDVEFFAKYGKELPDDYQRKIEGLSVVETAIFTKKEYDFDLSIDDMIAEWNQMAHEHYANRIDFKPYARQMLELLKEKGIKLGIATSNSKFLFDAFAIQSGLYDYIDVAITGEDVKCGKPEPECYLTAAKRLNVNPENCLVFEDITVGIKAGINAGMKTCAVEDSYSVHQREDKLKMADYYIDSFDKIIDLIKEI